MSTAPRRPYAHARSPLPIGAVGVATALTARQQQILDWIRSFIGAQGMPPTRAEISTALGFSSASSAEDHLQALAKKGAISIVPGAARGIRLNDLAGVPMQGTLPLVGRVAAGSPILATEHIEARYRVDPALFTSHADYLLRVRGDSMKGAGIHDGDLLAVRKSAEARNGQIVVVRLGDEVTVKRFRRRGRDIVLMPENAAFQPIVVDARSPALAIEGIAVGLVRDAVRW